MPQGGNRRKEEGKFAKKLQGIPKQWSLSDSEGTGGFFCDLSEDGGQKIRARAWQNERLLDAEYK